MREQKSPLFVFCHIEKCGGQTLINLLRCNFGLRHIDIIPMDETAHLAGADDIDRAMRMHRSPMSIAGHGLRPFGNYGDYAERMIWYGLLREPIARMNSDYRNDCRARGFIGHLADWAEFPHTHNFMTHALSATGDVKEAMYTLEQRFAYFGLMEDYNAFLIGLPALFQPLAFDLRNQPRNMAETAKIEKRLGANAGFPMSNRDIEAARAANADDLKLWEFAIHLKQRESVPVRVAGCSPKKGPPSAPQKLRRFVNVFWRNLIYKPSIGIAPGHVRALPRARMNARDFASKTSRRTVPEKSEKGD